MDFSWSSFVLEIINFLVLIWILKRFLYKPVLNVINKRRAGIEESLAGARQQLEEAQALQTQYQNRLQDWDRIKQEKRKDFDQELDSERARRLTVLQQELELEREKSKVAENRRQEDIRKEIEERALQQGSRFATSLLRHGAGPEMEAKLIELVVSDLNSLHEHNHIDLLRTYGKPLDSIEVRSAYEIGADQRQRLESVLTSLLPEPVPVQFHVNPDLIAGLDIRIGTWQLNANLRDELRGFSEISHAR